MLHGTVVLEHVEEPVSSQFMQESVLILCKKQVNEHDEQTRFFLGLKVNGPCLCGREGPGDEGDKGDVLRLEDLPAVLQSANGSLAGAQSRGGTGLSK